MSILWCGGEDIDFPNGGIVVVSTNAANKRSIARCSVLPLAAGWIKSLVFIGGEVTSCWLSCEGYITSPATGLNRIVGIGKSGTDKGLFVGCGATTPAKLTLYKFDGTTATALATESGASITEGLHRFDIQLTNYGASSAVNVYMNGNLLIAFSGDSSIATVTGFDSVFSHRYNVISYTNISEVIVADEDTRLFSLATLGPAAAGDANAWTGLYSAIDEVTLSDADTIHAATADLECQFNLDNTPAGSYVVKAVGVSWRGSDGVGGLGIEGGIKTNSAIHLGTTRNPGASWQNYQELYNENPETNNIFSIAEVDALQLAFKSVAV